MVAGDGGRRHAIYAATPIPRPPRDTPNSTRSLGRRGGRPHGRAKGRGGVRRRRPVTDGAVSGGVAA